MKFDIKDMNRYLASAILAFGLGFYLMNDHSFLAGVFALPLVFASASIGLGRARIPVPDKLKEHLPYVLAILLAAVLYSHSYFSLTQLVNLDYQFGDFPDMVKYSHPFVKVMRDAYLGGEIPLWSPWTWSGYPFQATPDKPVFYPFLVLFLLMPTSYGALNASIVFHIALTGLGMYWLVSSVGKTREGGLVAGIVYMLGGPIVSMLDVGGLPYIMAPALVPFTFLFAHRALFGKDWVKDSLLAAITFALLFHSGAVQYFQYAGILVGLYYLYYLALKRSPKLFRKMVLIGILAGVVMGGLIAVKLLPNLDYVSITNRANAYERASWPGVLPNWKGIRYFLITPLFDRFGDMGAHIGLVGFALALYSFKAIGRPRNLFMVLASLFAVSLASASPVYQFFWQYVPGINQGIYVQRFLIIYTLAAAFLAGVGTKVLLERFKPPERVWVLALVALLAFAELTLITYEHSPSEDLEAHILENKALQYIKSQPGLFRMHSLQTGGIDTSMSPYSVPMELYTLYGFDGSMWITAYMNEFLSVGMREPDKFWGLLNVKYLLSSEPVEHESFTLVDKFTECADCLPDRVDGPYVYENSRWMPRAFGVRSAVLVLGEGDPALNWMYTLMLNPQVDPAHTAVVLGKEPEVPKLSLEYLNRFDAVFLANVKIDTPTLNRLMEYVAQGGKIYPDVLNQKTSISEEEVASLFGAFTDRYSDVGILEYSPNRVVVDAPQGWLVMSEKYYMFPGGWRAEVSGEQLQIERTDGGLSSVYLPQEGRVVFTYFPTDFRNGLYVTLITIAGLIVYQLSKRRG